MSRSVGGGRALQTMVSDTKRMLTHNKHVLKTTPDMWTTLEEVSRQVGQSTALVVMGRSGRATARLLHALLGRTIINEHHAHGRRWIRIQYGPCTLVHLVFGNSIFEIVEELDCNKRSWDTLPIEIVHRQDDSDYSSIVEIELNNQYLKDGLIILVPPDLIEYDPNATCYGLMQTHKDFYNQREEILKACNCIYLYGIDYISNDIFIDAICPNAKEPLFKYEDLWTKYDMHYMGLIEEELKNQKPIGVVDNEQTSQDCDDVDEEMVRVAPKEHVFNAVHCADLRVMKRMSNSAQVLMFLLEQSEVSRSKPDMCIRCKSKECHCWINEATESAEGCSNDLPESEQGNTDDGVQVIEEILNPNTFIDTLIEQWDLTTTPTPKYKAKTQSYILNDRQLIQNASNTVKGWKNKQDNRVISNRTTLLGKVVKFTSECLQTHILENCQRLSEVHVRLVHVAVWKSFECARRLEALPQRVAFAHHAENKLYQKIVNRLTSAEYKQEIVMLIQKVLDSIKHEIEKTDWSIDDLPFHQDTVFAQKNTKNTDKLSIKELVSQEYIYESDDGKDNEAISFKNEEQDEESGVYEDYEVINNFDKTNVSDYYRAIEQLNWSDSSSQVISTNSKTKLINKSQSTIDFSQYLTPATCQYKKVSTCNAYSSVERCVLDLVGRRIGQTMTQHLQCFGDASYGTLYRCVKNLCEIINNHYAMDCIEDIKQIIRRVHVESSSNSLWSKITRKWSLGSSSGQWCCACSGAWRRETAVSVAKKLDAQHLAKITTRQLLMEISQMHQKFSNAMSDIQHQLSNRLHQVEDTRLDIRRRIAPEVARLCLESSSMCDTLMYGVPELGNEIGRGVFGVVRVVRGTWRSGGSNKLVAKCVSPTDRRHYCELALETFYARAVPRHRNVCRVLGAAVVGAARLVLSAMERAPMDLWLALGKGMPPRARARIARDVAAALKHLHAVGLVHRDVKLHNVLVWGGPRAQLADLGFGAAEPLLGGSLVGTPVHMAPELIAQRYGASVDIYAFAILFWYLCANTVKLPSAFEGFQNKEQLWSKVKRGLRPERLSHFNEECWSLMQQAWSQRPEQRPSAAELSQRLQNVHSLPAPSVEHTDIH